MKPTTPHLNLSNTQRLITYFLIIILFLCVFSPMNQTRLGNLLSFTRDNLCTIPMTDSSNSSSSPSDEIRVLLGILTLPDQYQKRHFLRMIYGTQSPAGAKVDLKFVFCNLTKEDQKVLVALEIIHYNDIIILNCHENMNKGKTFTYFSSLPGLFNNPDTPYPPYHYILKADDDTYFRLDNLVSKLRPLPRRDLYYGYVVPCPSMDPFKYYMSGMGYLVSWDIAEWVRDSDVPRAHVDGPEDKVFGEWLRLGRRGKNRFNAKWSMYDYPEPQTRCTHELWPDTVAVHRLKTQQKWIKTLQYFNVTQSLKPSKLYHIPL